MMQWMPLVEFVEQPQIQEDSMFKKIIDICIARMGERYCGLAPHHMVSRFDGKSSSLYYNVTDTLQDVHCIGNWTSSFIYKTSRTYKYICNKFKPTITTHPTLSLLTCNLASFSLSSITTHPARIWFWSVELADTFYVLYIFNNNERIMVPSFWSCVECCNQIKVFISDQHD